MQEIPTCGPWTPEQYRALLKRIVASRAIWAPESCAGIPPSNAVWLRHDVEVDLVAALEMAKLETALGIATNYFICPESPFFEGMRDEVVVTIGEIQALGHCCFPHLVMNHGENLDALRPRSLQMAAQFKLSSSLFTIHAPDKAILQSFVEVEGCRFIYRMITDDRFGYFSDSTRAWRSGFPEEGDARPLQLLTHPIWWSGTRTFELCVAQAETRGVPLCRLAAFLPKLMPV